MKPIERLYEYLEFKGIKPTSYAKKINVSQGYLSTQYSRKASIGSDVIENIIHNSEDVNPEWLLTGRGSMLREGSETPVKSYQKNLLPVTTIEKHMVSAKNPGLVTIMGRTLKALPIIPGSAIAGYGKGEELINLDETEWMLVQKHLASADFLIPAHGDSMQPEIYAGDYLACKQVFIDFSFQYNRVYVIHTDQATIVKKVRKCKEDDSKIELHSSNTDYDPYPMPKESIYAIALVIGMIRVH